MKRIISLWGITFLAAFLSAAISGEIVVWIIDRTHLFLKISFYKNLFEDLTFLTLISFLGFLPSLLVRQLWRKLCIAIYVSAVLSLAFWGPLAYMAGC